MTSGAVVTITAPVRIPGRRSIHLVDHLSLGSPGALTLRSNFSSQMPCDTKYCASTHARPATIRHAPTINMLVAGMASVQAIAHPFGPTNALMFPNRKASRPSISTPDPNKASVCAILISRNSPGPSLPRRMAITDIINPARTVARVAFGADVAVRLQGIWSQLHLSDASAMLLVSTSSSFSRLFATPSASEVRAFAGTYRQQTARPRSSGKARRIGSGGASPAGVQRRDTYLGDAEVPPWRTSSSRLTVTLSPWNIAVVADNVLASHHSASKFASAQHSVEHLRDDGGAVGHAREGGAEELGCDVGASRGPHPAASPPVRIGPADDRPAPRSAPAPARRGGIGGSWPAGGPPS